MLSLTKWVLRSGSRSARRRVARGSETNICSQDPRAAKGWAWSAKVPCTPGHTRVTARSPVKLL